jgi:hypothetical protein
VTAPVAQRDRLGDDAFDADCRHAGRRVLGPGERGVGEGGERQRAELRVDAVEHGFNLERDLTLGPARTDQRLTPPTPAPASLDFPTVIVRFTTVCRAFHGCELAFHGRGPPGGRTGASRADSCSVGTGAR